MSEPNYYREFARSGFHGGLLAGVAAAFASANPLFLMAAAAGYALAWVYGPTSGPFVRRVQERLRLEAESQNSAALADFVVRRDSLVGRLNEDGRRKYYDLSDICAEVSRTDPENSLVNGKLQELLWTYLKMLTMKQGIDGYLAETDEKKIDSSIVSVAEETRQLGEGQERLRASKEALLETLRQHKKTLVDARENRQILESEAARLEHEIQLLRADAVADRSSDFLSAKIDASVESLQESKNILQSMGSVQEMSMDIPPEIGRLGFESSPEGNGRPRPIRGSGLAGEEGDGTAESEAGGARRGRGKTAQKG